MNMESISLWRETFFLAVSHSTGTASHWACRSHSRDCCMRASMGPHKMRNYSIHDS
jgi:hypothetical protein